jgi:hypothetical protein
VSVFKVIMMQEMLLVKNVLFNVKLVIKLQPIVWNAMIIHIEKQHLIASVK